MILLFIQTPSITPTGVSTPRRANGSLRFGRNDDETSQLTIVRCPSPTTHRRPLCPLLISTNRVRGMKCAS